VFGSATQYWGSKERKRNHVIVQHRKVDWPIKLVPLLRDYMFSLAVYGNFCFKKKETSRGGARLLREKERQKEIYA
jgi:hypothetical protein